MRGVGSLPREMKRHVGYSAGEGAWSGFQENGDDDAFMVL